jgi:NADP-dependent 3-hydroxy acid dehydrogenase YdfG
LTGRLALVTGASGDIGRAITAALCAEAFHVLAVGRDPDRLARAVEKHDAEPVIADLTRPGDVAAVRDRVAQHGHLDALVLGSGIYERSRAPDALARQLAANVHGPYALLQSVWSMLAAARGQVVVINSTQGLRAAPGVGQFAATQHAMKALADSLREDLNALGVRMTSVFLGRTATARQAAIFALEQRAYTPGLLIQPEDVARIVLDVLTLPRTAEITDISLRPMHKPQ